MTSKVVPADHARKSRPQVTPTSALSSIKARRRRAALRLLLDEPGSSKAAACAFFLIIAAIVVSVLTFFLSSVKSLVAADGGHSIWVVEACCVAIFSLEVALRTVVATMDVKALLLKDAYYYIDLLAIIPFYVDLIVTLPPAWRWVQLLRLLRILKLLRHCTLPHGSTCAPTE